MTGIDIARALQGQPARAHRRDRRPSAVDVLGYGAVAAANQGRKSARARRVHRGRLPSAPESRRSPKPAFPASKPPAGACSGAGRHAEGDGEQAASRAQRRAGVARDPAADHQARHDPGRAVVARGAAALHQRPRSSAGARSCSKPASPGRSSGGGATPSSPAGLSQRVGLLQTEPPPPLTPPPPPPPTAHLVPSSENRRSPWSSSSQNA